MQHEHAHAKCVLRKMHDRIPDTILMTMNLEAIALNKLSQKNDLKT